MVEVFKTNITDSAAADNIISELQKIATGISVSFDLDDCDKILRIVSSECVTVRTIDLLLEKGYQCEVLPD